MERTSLNWRDTALAIAIVLMLLSSSIVSNSAYQLSNSPLQLPKQVWWFKAESNINNFAVLGYNNLAATFMWMNTLAYLGNPNRENRNYDYLATRLESIVQIYPTLSAPYYVAAVILPWETSSTIDSNRLLDRAMRAMPNEWYWPYYRGFNAYWFDHDMETAALFLSKSASMDKSPSIVTTLALRMRAESGQLDTAIMFLNRLLNEKGQNTAIRQQLLKQRNAIETEKVLRQIDIWLSQLAKRPYSRIDLNTLQRLGFHLPSKLPDGGYVTFNAEGNIVSSVSGKRYKVFVPKKRQRRVK